MSRQRTSELASSPSPVTYKRLIRENERLRSEISQLSQRVYVDALTGLHNRALFNECIPKEVATSVHTGIPLGVLMLDIDHFKKVNDTYGHLEGDAVLQQVGQALLGSVRTHEKVFRYGGEEFAVLVPQSDLISAVVLAERLRLCVNEVVLDQKPVTISIGVAVCPDQGNTARDIILAADRALHEAKQLGRDQVRVAGKTKN